jgi:hypothetical protein
MQQLITKFCFSDHLSHSKQLKFSAVSLVSSCESLETKTETIFVICSGDKTEWHTVTRSADAIMLSYLTS